MKHYEFKLNSYLGLAFCLALLIQIYATHISAQRYSGWSAPVNLGVPVNTAALDGCPFISKDGLDMIFATNRPTGSGPVDLYVSHRETINSDWGDAISLGPDINTAGFSEFCPTLTVSERYLYFVSDRPGGCGGNDIYVVRRLTKDSFTAWGEPANLGCQLNSPQSDITPSVFEDEGGAVFMYFSSNRPGGMGAMDIYASVLQPDGTFGEPTNVAELNTTFNDQRPNVRVRDGLEIFLDSNRPGSLNNSLDLYTSTRDTTSSVWSAPANLGSTVNSIAVEGRASLSFDGTHLYFGSNRAGTIGDQDIYVVTRTKLTGR